MLTGIFSTLLIPETKQKTLEDLSNENQEGFVQGMIYPSPLDAVHSVIYFFHRCQRVARQQRGDSRYGCIKLVEHPPCPYAYLTPRNFIYLPSLSCLS